MEKKKGLNDPKQVHNLKTQESSSLTQGCALRPTGEEVLLFGSTMSGGWVVLWVAVPLLLFSVVEWSYFFNGSVPGSHTGSSPTLESKPVALLVALFSWLMLPCGSSPRWPCHPQWFPAWVLWPFEVSTPPQHC